VTVTVVTPLDIRVVYFAFQSDPSLVPSGSVKLKLHGADAIPTVFGVLFIKV
jgi:hypothetical protein